MGVWEERAGRNEALFRDVNENIAKLQARLPGVSEVIPAICECSRAGCTTQIEITPDEYAAVRRHPDRFIVALSHEDPSIEHAWRPDAAISWLTRMESRPPPRTPPPPDGL
ncbi:MAG TPA: hypothetical protein VF124_02230 [Gaiellaceae bacterium]